MKSRRTSRSGYSLHEVAIMVGVFSFLTLLSIRVLHQSLGFAKSANVQHDFRKTASRLSVQFRADTHTSQAVQIDEENRLEFRTSEGRSIRYEVANSGRALIRLGENREAYLIPEGMTVRFAKQDSNGFVSLEYLKKIVGTQGETSQELRVLARLGRHL